MYPETSGRPLEQIDDYFSNATSWNVFKASRQIKAKGFADWRWTKKYSGGFEHSDAFALSQDDESKGLSSGEGENARAGGRLGALRRKASNAGLI